MINNNIVKAEKETPYETIAKDENRNGDNEAVNEAIFAKLAEVEERLKAIDEKMSKPLIG